MLVHESRDKQYVKQVMPAQNFQKFGVEEHKLILIDECSLEKVQSLQRMSCQLDLIKILSVT